MRMFEPNAGQQQVSMATTTTTTTNCQFFACYEDSSFIYRHRKRPRSGESPFDSSPASSTTTDSLLTNSVNFSDSSRSSNSSQSSNSTSKSLSPPPLTFNLLSTNSPAIGQQLSTSTPLSIRGASQTTSAKSACNRVVADSRSGRKSSCNDENEPQQQVANQLRLAQQAVHNQELEDERVFHNLILRERRFEESRASMSGQVEPALAGQSRHLLLSWMLRICEYQSCQDEIFPLATIILDNFLRINPMISASRRNQNRHEHHHHHHHHNHHHHHHNLHHNNHNLNNHLSEDNHCQHHNDTDTCSPSTCADQPMINYHFNDQTNDNDEQLNNQQVRELEQRQLLLFAACSLLLATKLRQTPRLFIQTLIEFSKFELPIELGRDEIINGELLMLSMLKWDLAALVTPNEFLQELLARKCHRVLMNFLDQPTDRDDGSPARPANTMAHDDGHDNNRHQLHQHSDGDTGKLVNRVSRHTQTLLELCLMDSQLSQYSSSMLAMSSMAVAINGLSKTTKNACLGLDEIVVQIHESTNEVNELEPMIDVAFQIEKYVQTLLHSTKDD